MFKLQPTSAPTPELLHCRRDLDELQTRRTKSNNLGWNEIGILPSEHHKLVQK